MPILQVLLKEPVIGMFQLTVPAPNSIAQFVPLIIMNGESNSGGIGLNSDLAASELLSRSSVQILNNNTLNFESLLIGSNNLIGHAGLESYASNSHGWEAGLANAVEAGLFKGFNQVFLVKTGQGGSVIDQWVLGGSFFTTYISRVQIAKQLILNMGKTPIPYIWYTQGINDRIAGTSGTTWKTKTIEHFKNLRRYIGYAPVIAPLFMSGQDPYNTYLSEIQATEKYLFTVDSTGAGLRDGNHWNAQGLKLLASRMVDVTVNLIGLDFYNYLSTGLLALSGSAPTTRVTSLLMAPTITSQPQNVSVAESQTASFSVSVIGTAPITYQWQRQNNGGGFFANIGGANEATYTTNTLTISNDNGASYRCVISNGQGSVTSNPAVLTVTPSVSNTVWTGLIAAINGSPSIGYIKQSGGLPSGGTGSQPIDATQPFELIYQFDSGSGSAVIYLSSTNTASYSWTPGDLISGIRFGGGNTEWFVSIPSNFSVQIVGTIPSFPALVKVVKSGNDLQYSASYNNGASYSPIYTHTNALAGAGTMYIKTLFATQASQQVKVIRTV